MSAFSNWQQYVVKQKRLATGCIPTGYEMILRAAGITHVDFTTFQDEFDLDTDLKPGVQPRNNFESVAQAISARYPDIRFKRLGFGKGEGQKKLEAVERMISHRIPVLISLALAPFGGRGWHIMPVVDSTTDSLTLLWGVDDSGSPQTETLKKSDFVDIHENFPGGDDIAILDR